VSRRRNPRKLPPIGNDGSECPYCFTPLEPRPGRKKKCPHCGEYIYVRKRPSDGRRVLLTEAQVEELEEQWSIANGRHEEYVAKRQQWEKAKRHLTRAGVEPSKDMVEFHLYSEEAMRHAKLGNMAEYRDAQMGMATVLEREGRAEAALSKYLGVWYMDLNGPGLMSITDALGRRVPLSGGSPWRPSRSRRPDPRFVKRVRELVAECGLDGSQVKQAFMHAAEAVQCVHPPTPPDEAWRQLAKDLLPPPA